MSAFFFYCYGDHRDLHSFPTRRSSDLRVVAALEDPALYTRPDGAATAHTLGAQLETLKRDLDAGLERWTQATRSEEHTSELQSHVNLVCRLLLEKKKKKKKKSMNYK